MKTYNPYKNQKGSILALAMIFAIVMAAVVGSYLKLVMTELRLSDQATLSSAAINSAEAGCEEATYALNHTWTGWTEKSIAKGDGTFVGNMQYKQMPTVALDDRGNKALVQVLVKDFATPRPIIYTKTSIERTYGAWSQKQIEVKLKGRSPWPMGLIAKRVFSGNGNNVVFDSYNSSNAPYDPNNPSDKCTVGSLLMKNDSNPNGVELGNANDFGYAVTSGSGITWGPNVEIRGKDTPDGVKVDPNRLSYDFVADFPLITAPAPAPTDVLVTTFTQNKKGTTTMGNSAYTPGADCVTYYYDLRGKSISQTGGVINIQGCKVIVVVDSLSQSGQGQITIANGSNAEFYVSGSVIITGLGATNMSTGDKTLNMKFIGTNPTPGAVDWKIAGNGKYAGLIYAPNNDLKISGAGCSGIFLGGIIANNITANGHVELHYDEALQEDKTNVGFKMKTWRELVDPAEKLVFPPLVR